MAFKFKKLDIPEVIHIEPDIYGDDRGYFAELYKLTDFRSHGIDATFVQTNYAKSGKNVLRGLHYQRSPMAQGKLVTVVEGEIFDVAVDLRPDSPNFRKWVAKKLDAARKNMLYIPEGFAHGFCVLSEIAQVIYYCSEVYSPEHEMGVLWNDPAIGVDWPVDNPVLSEKDQKFTPLG